MLLQAVVTEEKNNTNREAPEANLQIFPPNNGGNAGQGTPADTDVVLNRLMCSLNPTSGDFFNKIDANPDLYGLVWISTTLVAAISSFGNLATYLMHKQGDTASTRAFDVGYMSVAAFSVYGYAFIVPLGFYFLLQYLGSNANLFLLIIPVEFIKWIVILLTGAMSGTFVTLNLKSFVQTNDLAIVPIAAFVLQMGLAIFIKMWFFP
nr:protein YIPF1 homolog isoform X1 [Ipomoea batatas]